MKGKFFLGVLFLGIRISTFSQEFKQLNSSEIYHQLLKLRVMGSVLYVAAHPDDENTRLITWLANEKKLNSAYFSFTRGEGGQNLIGEELSEELGVIRTHELNKAREIDGGIQFFSRAADFGYSKSSEETFTIWKRKKVMHDLIYVVRKFQPDLIITRFNTDEGKTHGHHTASAILANSIIELSNDSNEAYDQLPFVDLWTVPRVVWNASSFFFDKGANLDSLIKIDCGKFNSLLGASYTEIAALSRSCHKSQGFGTSGIRGEQWEYFIPSAGTNPENKDIFSGYDFTWNRIKNGKSIIPKIDGIIARYNFNDPSGSVEDLIDLYIAIHKINDGSYLVNRKLNDVLGLINQCLGFYHELYTDDYIYAVGDTLRLKSEMINRSGKYLSYINVRLPYWSEWLTTDLEYNRQVNGNEIQKWTSGLLQIKSDAFISNPLWWNFKTIDSDPLTYGRIVENRNFEPFTYTIAPSFNNKKPIDGLVFTGKIMHKKNHPEKGEIHQPIYLAPPVTASPMDEILIFNANEPQKVKIQLQSFKSNCTGIVKLEVSEGWKVSPSEINFSLSNKRETKNVEFMVTPPDSNSRGILHVNVSCSSLFYSAGFKEINYDHLPAIVLFPEAKIPLIKLGNSQIKSTVAYIDGAGDDVAEVLMQGGYTVNVIKPDELLTTDYAKFRTVILGIRSYNTIDNIFSLQNILMDFVKKGGNLIVQYNTSNGLKVKENGPLPFKIGRDRVTDENADMAMLDPTHPLFNYPHKITENDFKGWVQERGLYFALDWDKSYIPLLASHDKGEEDKKGILITTKYGKGNFTYTGLSFFRQLPAGVPGAYKLLVNLIELK